MLEICVVWVVRVVVASCDANPSLTSHASIALLRHIFCILGIRVDVLQCSFFDTNDIAVSARSTCLTFWSKVRCLCAYSNLKRLK